MKKLVVLPLLMLCVSVLTVSAEVISQPAATVNLIRNTIITVENLQARTAEYQQELKAANSPASITPSEVLDIMINDELVLQGAERDGYLVSSSRLDQLVAAQRSAIEQQVGRKLTDDEFTKILQSNFGLNLAQFRKSLGESATVDSYVRAKYPDLIATFTQPTDAEIQEFFRANRAQFMNPELVRISHIFMPFNETDNATVKTEMEKLSRWIKYNTYTFEELVPKYSKDAVSATKGGDIGWLSYDDADMREVLGPSFFEAVFALAVGKPSGVLESKSGYHIVKVVTHTDPKLLAIQDTINPESTVTVYKYIEQRLLSQRQQDAYIKAINKLVEDLRSQAKIEILYK